jgi:CheY-like chemotaxis protein
VDAHSTQNGIINVRVWESDPTWPLFSTYTRETERRTRLGLQRARPRYRFQGLPPDGESSCTCNSVPRARGGLAAGSETIPVVEDDASLREVTCQFLQGAGYKALAAATPHEGLLTAEQNRGKIDFLVTDLIMPKMNGRELAIQLTSRWPNIKVLYVSGYTDSLVKDGIHGVLEGGLEFLQKPFTRRALTQKIRLILDSGKAQPVASLMGPI